MAKDEVTTDPEFAPARLAVLLEHCAEINDDRDRSPIR
jgi:hypothetical protein